MSMMRKLRRSLCLTQEEMAKKLDISPNAYRNYESGKRMLPYDVLIRFLKLRNDERDLELVKVLEELYVKL